jgi:molybdopterin synthase sulfur carrier subunit
VIPDQNNKAIITARFFGQFKQISNEREIEYELEIGVSINEFLIQVIKQFPKMKELLFDENALLHNWVSILKNGRNIKALQGIDTSIGDGDIIAIFPPVAGG